MIAGCRSLRYFGMDVQNGDVIFMKSNQVGKGTHDWFELGESGAIALGNAKGAHRDLTRFDRILKLNRVTQSLDGRFQHIFLIFSDSSWVAAGMTVIAYSWMPVKLGWTYSPH